MVARLVGLDPTVVNFLVVEQLCVRKLNFWALEKVAPISTVWGLGG
jgi:hypothetical protein